MEQIINSPTRVTPRTSSTIDVIITNRPEKITNSGVIPISLSDHYMVYCTLGSKHNACNENCHRFNISRNIGKVDVDDYVHDVDQISWEEVETFENVESAYNYFENRLLKVIEKHAPLRKKRIRKLESPWMTEEIIVLIRSRNCQKARAIVSKNEDDWNVFRRLRNQITMKIRKAKAAFITKSVVESTGNSGKVWKSLKRLMPVKSTDEIKCIEKDSKELRNKKDIANAFNSFFVEIGPSLQEKSSFVDKQFEEYIRKYDCTCTFEDITEEQIVEVLKNLPPKKTSGSDNIPSLLLKPVANIISKPLAYIFNLTIQTGKIPTQLKCSRVIPVHKNGQRSEMGNYRPISILSVIAKILEKLIFNQLYSYLSSNSIIDVKQSGFRPQHSTATALLNVTEDWLDSLDKGDIVGMVTIDLKKAFDTVDHAILLDKLKLIGLDKRACEWFLNYLTDRRQYTVVNGVKSDELNVICGIPQGAI